MITNTLFQFPSNGKAYRKGITCRSKPCSANVSIPFKRESVSQGSEAYHAIMVLGGCFNSLQTGKRIASYCYCRTPVLLRRHLFQFPSNGKAYRKSPVMATVITAAVSSFNSLQTGKRIASQHLRMTTRQFWIKFQFPSNGKAYRKVDRASLIEERGLCFNSLQTGKRIASKRHHLVLTLDFCFNSLQTGKRIAS